MEPSTAPGQSVSLLCDNIKTCAVEQTRNHDCRPFQLKTRRKDLDRYNKYLKVGYTWYKTCYTIRELRGLSTS